MRRQMRHRKTVTRKFMSPKLFAAHTQGGGIAEVIKKPFKALKGVLPYALLAAELARAGSNLTGKSDSALGRLVHDPRLIKAESVLRLGQRLGAL